MKKLVLLLIISTTLTFCKKESISNSQLVEIYLLETAQMAGNKCAIEPTTAVLKNDPLIENNEILSYNQNTFEFKLRTPAISKLKALPGRTPFAVTVNKQVIYFGFYMPSHISSTCFESVTMDVNVERNRMILTAGYPWPAPSSDVKDERNNTVLLKALRSQGKMIQ